MFIYVDQVVTLLLKTKTAYKIDELVVENNLLKVSFSLSQEVTEAKSHKIISLE